MLRHDRATFEDNENHRGEMAPAFFGMESFGAKGDHGILFGSDAGGQPSGQ